jgi:hypothetical protein
MKFRLNSTLAATLIATLSATIAWFTGYIPAVWPTHPQLATIVITILISIAVRQAWPVPVSDPQN